MGTLVIILAVIFAVAIALRFIRYRKSVSSLKVYIEQASTPEDIRSAWKMFIRFVGKYGNYSHRMTTELRNEITNKRERMNKQLL